jgi:hypothetical protein
MNTQNNFDTELRKLAAGLQVEPSVKAKENLEAKLRTNTKSARLIPDWFWGVAASVSVLLIATWTVYQSTDGLSAFRSSDSGQYIVNELDQNIEEGIYSSQSIYTLNEAYNNAGL